jgi:maltose O-acetyltransferase
MLAGELYRAGDPELEADRRRAHFLNVSYNSFAIDDPQRALHLLRDLLGAFGEESVIRPPFYCDYGSNIRIGNGVFLNFGCVLLDVAAIEVGDYTQIGPNVQIYTADHPREAALRRVGFERGKPIRIGRNVWIGGGAILLPGITIGDDAIIGAGSVVTADVPPGATAVGNPARLLPPRLNSASG